MTKYISLIFVFAILFSCRQHHTVTVASTVNDSLHKDTAITSLTLKGMTVTDFLHLVIHANNKIVGVNIFFMEDDAPENWVKAADVDSLIKLVHSKDRCNCYVNPYSSHIPLDSADLGGYAIALIKSFREKKELRFGLWACPKTNEKDARELVKWLGERK